MAYVRFHSQNFHEEQCGFDFGVEEPCRKPAIGFRGKRIKTRIYLCEEHFEYGIRVDNEREEMEKVTDG